MPFPVVLPGAGSPNLQLPDGAPAAGEFLRIGTLVGNTATMEWVDTADYALLTGGTFTGPVTLEDDVTIGTAAGASLTITDGTAGVVITADGSGVLFNNLSGDIQFEPGLGEFLVDGDIHSTADFVGVNAILNGTIDVAGHSAFGANAQVDDVMISGPFSCPVVQHVAEVFDEVPPTNSYVMCQSLEHQLDPTDDATGTGYFLVNGNVESKAGNTKNWDSWVGYSLLMEHKGSGTVGGMYGSSLAVQNRGVSTVATVVGQSVRVGSGGGGVVTNAYGINIRSALEFTGGSIINNVGLLIDNQAGIGSTISRNLWSKGASSENLFEGKVTVNGHSAIGNQASIDTSYLGPAYTTQAVINCCETYNGNIPDGNYIYLANFEAELDPAVDGPNSSYFTINAWTVTKATNTRDWYSVGGVLAYLEHKSSGDVYDFAAGSYIAHNVSTATIQYASGVIASTGSRAGGTIVNAQAVWAQRPVKLAGTITNNVGVLIEDQSGIGSTISRNLWSKGSTTTNLFEGTVQAGKIEGIDASGANVAATDLVIDAPQSTGNATPAKIKIRVAAAGSSGSSLQSLSEVIELSNDGISVTGNVTVTNDDYAAGWNGSVQVPTKNAVYDKIQAVSLKSSPFFDSAPADGTITLEAKARVASTINGLYGVKTSAGTVTIAVQINGVSVTGLSAVNVTTTPQDVTASALNAVAVGDRVTLVISSASSAADLEFSMETLR